MESVLEWTQATGLSGALPPESAPDFADSAQSMKVPWEPEALDKTKGSP